MINNYFLIIFETMFNTINQDEFNTKIDEHFHKDEDNGKKCLSLFKYNKDEKVLYLDGELYEHFEYLKLEKLNFFESFTHWYIHKFGKKTLKYVIL